MLLGERDADKARLSRAEVSLSAAVKERDALAKASQQLQQHLNDAEQVRGERDALMRMQAEAGRDERAVRSERDALSVSLTAAVKERDALAASRRDEGVHRGWARGAAGEGPKSMAEGGEEGGEKVGDAEMRAVAAEERAAAAERKFLDSEERMRIVVEEKKSAEDRKNVIQNMWKASEEVTSRATLEGVHADTHKPNLCHLFIYLPMHTDINVYKYVYICRHVGMQRCRSVCR